MYVLIGKKNCNQCNILKNLLDEKGIQYHYVDVSKITHELLTYLRMYCNTYPIVLGVKYFRTFNETLKYFNDIWIPASQEDFLFLQRCKGEWVLEKFSESSLPFRSKKRYLSIRGLKKNVLKKRSFREILKMTNLLFFKKPLPNLTYELHSWTLLTNSTHELHSRIQLTNSTHESN
jgi:hypothetical protein